MAPIKKEQYQKTKIEELESIRGLAALLIVIYHIPHWNSSFYDYGIIKNAYLMVELFFVLSGFVICTSYGTSITTSTQLVRFQFLRFGRLYPVHFLFLLICFFIELSKYIAQTKFGIVSPNTQPFRENNLTAFIQNVFLVQAIGPTGNTATFNGPAWSISVEFYTYLVFGVITLYFNKIKQYFFATIFLVSLLLLISKNTYGFENVLRCFAGFFLGCIIANIKRYTCITLPSFSSLIAFLVILFFLIYKQQREYDFVFYFLTATLIFTLVSSKDGPVKKLLGLKVLVWLGSISYSMYMCHFVIKWIANQVFRVLLNRSEIIVDGISTPHLSLIEAAIGYVSVLTIVLIVSSLCYKFVEEPFRNKSRQIIFNS